MSAQSIGDLSAAVVNDLAQRTDRVRQFPELDRYRWWRDALAGKPGMVVHEGTPELGFYRRKRRGGGFDPAAIFESDGQIVCVVAGNVKDAAEEWTWLCGHPISEAEYRRVAEEGLPWSDMDPTVAASLSAPPATSHNEPADEAEILRDQIESAKAGAAGYRAIKDDETEKRAQSLRSRLLELAGTVKKKHKVEKAPSLDESRRIDDRWLPMAKDAEAAAVAVRLAIEDWQNEKLARERADQRRAEAAQRRAEEDARKAREAGQESREPPPEPAPLPLAATPSAGKIKGAYGKAASVRLVRVAIVEDYAQAALHFQADHDLRALIDRLSQRAVDAGHQVPGVKTEERRRVA